MICRYWRGWVSTEKADAFEQLLRKKVLPGISVKGYRGAYVMRREVAGTVEVATLTLWDSLDAVKEFAGADYQVAVVSDEAKKLLSNFDRVSVHYDVVMEPGK
ncbi:MAG: antibiotic biosynthesis monooxygenase [Candidatus Acidiferrales bacterium]